MANPYHDPENGQFTSGPSGYAANAKSHMAESITAFHGSPHSFSDFDINRVGTTTDSGFLGKAVYLSTDARVGTSQNIQYEVDVSLSNPLKISMTNFRQDKMDLARGALNLPANATSADITKAAKLRGHDGVILDYSPTGYYEREIAAFDPSSLKIKRKKKNG